MATSYTRLKLLIDSKTQRVLFGEVDKKFIDFLFNLLTLPLGTVIRLLKTRDGTVGCLGNLFDSVEALNETYWQPNQGKHMLLKPKYTFSGPNLHFDLGSSAAMEIYMCSSRRCSRGLNVANDPTAVCPSCRKQMNIVCTLVHPPSADASLQQAKNVEGGYVKGVVTYMVMDDLSVEPMSTISSITLLNKFNIKEVSSLEEKIITLNVSQAVNLVKASLQSKTVLTDIFIEKKNSEDF